MDEFDYKSALAKVPELPGVYRYFDEEGTVIYVGKAKNLKNRVSSYFAKSNQHDRKTKRLVSQIRNLEFTIVHTEFDALLLENTLIKKFQPKYNILLRDDKMYPFICVTNEPFPKIITIRRVDKKMGTFFGPFANQKAMYAILEMFNQLYTFRTCNLNLNHKNIQDRKFKVCLEYHIGNCKGPCEGLQTEKDYLKEIDQAKNILKGNMSLPKQYFEEKMQEAASKLAFEEAQEFKEKLAYLVNFQSKSTVVNPNIRDVDVFSIVSDENAFYFNFMKVLNGFITQTQSLEVKKKLDETDEDILTMMVWEMRDKYESEAKEVITNIPLSVELKGVENTIPQIGDKKKLLEMSLKNVLYFKKEKADRQASEESAGDAKMRILLTLKNDLQLKSIPRHIECFDNSNIQGTNPVSAMVCFKNGIPSKKDYRHFTPKTVEGPNDFATMNEVVTRRYSRLLQEEADLPDLIIIDGGKGQLSASADALKNLGLYGKIPIIGIAKRLEEIYFPEDSIPLYIDKKSESLKLIQRLRDEAHRFGITKHRDKRSKNFIISQLESIDGIGKNTAEKLLKHFGTVSNIYKATSEDLETLLGKAKALKLKEQLKVINDQ
ncbi:MULTISPECIES: excinuclease ABC subunit UvrC [unclassified Arcicella]|uniref:excinuclease ABC subunit UvrC n=1 Tax=unclassified Arcicella TaxID=2644986 RepID=UPI00285D7AF3|nr:MULTISPECIES: excinuclease ABC subunit UvrC [unclassified Arcicella]MDR6563906.1 excinuclease ABC subunit C [Arcicella sp. BE51]MDR6813659.1 excinuclease ABC subunit C [Arcicella sp. BE140]MDR6824960.1 excinuclease ABC subunit C [Arcicella sp. BE139]